MGKLLPLLVGAELVVGVILLLENLVGSQQSDESLYNSLLHLVGLRDASSSSFADSLKEQGNKDKMEEHAVMFMIILTSVASVFLLLTWHKLSHDDTSEENLTCSGAAAVTQERETWSSACCCYMSPRDATGVKTYVINVKGEMDGNPCAQLKMTIHTGKDLDEKVLAALEDIILETLNKTDDINSPQSLLEVVYKAAMDYLRQQNLVDE